MFKLLMAICVTFPLAAVASSQTASELADRYQHHEVYEVQPGVQMTAKFASNWLVCEMQIEQAHFGKDGADLRKGLDKERVNGLIDQLVPPSERGEENPVDNMTLGTGQVLENVDSYSNVTVHVLSSHGTIVVTVKWQYRTC
jgi:hypothetical protein